MIYATEQQAVVTAVLVVVVALVSLFTGILWGHKRGMAEAAEEQRWAREQAKARRAHPVYRNPFQVQHENWPPPPQYGLPSADMTDRRARENQALAVASETRLSERIGQAGAEMWQEAMAAGGILEPTAVLSPQDMSVTGEIARMTADMEAFMARLIGGTDDQLKGITR